MMTVMTGGDHRGPPIPPLHVSLLITVVLADVNRDLPCVTKTETRGETPVAMTGETMCGTRSGTLFKRSRRRTLRPGSINQNRSLLYPESTLAPHVSPSAPKKVQKTSSNMPYSTTGRICKICTTDFQSTPQAVKQ